MPFRKITPSEFSENPFTIIDKDWMLVASADDSGDKCGKDYNMMTASWGGVGILWHKPVAFVFIRPQRHTFSFTERNERMTLSFFDENYRSALAFCGRKSGRDFDKAAECSLTPAFDENANGRVVWFEEARLVIITRKLYAQPLEERFALSETVTENYPENDYHMMYVAEIEEILVRE